MGSKSPDIKYAGSPIQDKMAGFVMPGFEKMYGSIGNTGAPGNQQLWNVPQYDVPEHQKVSPYDVTSQQKVSPYNVQQYATQNYQVPSTQGMMPNTGWFNNLDPSIQQSMMEPTNVAAREMLNTMGGQGMMSARGGYSGEAQTALGDLYSKGAQQAGMNAWNMISPIQQQQWGAQLGANQYGAEMGNQATRDIWGAKTGATGQAWGQNNTQNMMDWQARTGATQAAWGQNNMMNNADWQAQLGANQYGAQGQLQQNMLPWSQMANLWGGSVPNPVVSQGSGQNFMNNVGSPGIMGLLYGLGSSYGQSGK